MEKLEGETKRMVKVADRLQHEKIKSTETDGLLDVLPLKMESQLRDFERNAQRCVFQESVVCILRHFFFLRGIKVIKS